MAEIAGIAADEQRFVVRLRQVYTGIRRVVHGCTRQRRRAIALLDRKSFSSV